MLAVTVRQRLSVLGNSWQHSSSSKAASKRVRPLGDKCIRTAKCSLPNPWGYARSWSRERRGARVEQEPKLRHGPVNVATTLFELTTFTVHPVTFKDSVQPLAHVAIAKESPFLG